MQTKQIVAILAIMAVAVAGVAGVAYAYQATLTSELNTVQSDYIILNDSAGTINGYFSSGATDFQYSSETLDSLNAKYTPAGETWIYRGVMGTQVGTTMTMTIDSSKMNTGNWFTMYVKTDVAGGLATKDMDGAFALKYVYTPDTDTPAVKYTDIVILDNDNLKDLRSGGIRAIPAFMSPSIKAGTAQTVTWTLYALDYVSTIETGSPDYENINFQFIAETLVENTADVPTLISATVTAKNTAGSEAINAEIGTLYYNGARIIAASTTTSGVTTYTSAIPSSTAEDVYTASAHYVSDGKQCVFMSVPMTYTSGTLAIVVKEAPTGIAVNTYPTVAQRTVTSGTTTVEALLGTLNEGKFYAYYHGTIVETDVDLTGITPITTGLTIASGTGVISATANGSYRVFADFMQNNVTVSVPIWIVVTGVS